jgi:hypothetical protein
VFVVVAGLSALERVDGRPRRPCDGCDDRPSASLPTTTVLSVTQARTNVVAVSHLCHGAGAPNPGAARFLGGPVACIASANGQRTSRAGMAPSVLLFVLSLDRFPCASCT